MKHLLGVEELSREEMDRILERAQSFAEVGRRDIKKVPTLRGRTVVTLFYESSTRTSSSFELAAKRLSADTMTLKAVGSSVDKGESLKDTAQTLSAYDPDVIVLRHPEAGAPAARRACNGRRRGRTPGRASARRGSGARRPRSRRAGPRDGRAPAAACRGRAAPVSGVDACRRRRSRRAQQSRVQRAAARRSGDAA